MKEKPTRTIKAALAVKQINDGEAYSVGVELMHEGELVRIYSLYFNAEREEIYSKTQAVGAALIRVINELPKDTSRLMIRSANKLMYGYKQQKEKVGGVTVLPKRGLEIYMRLAEFNSPDIIRARDLAEDAKQRRESFTHY